MKKNKFIEGEEEKAYKARLKSFSASINPKPSEEERKAIIEQLKKARGQ